MTNFLLAGILVTMLLGAPTVLVLVAKLVVGTIRTVVSLVKLAAFGGFFISVWELLPTPPEWWGSYPRQGAP